MRIVLRLLKAFAACCGALIGLALILSCAVIILAMTPLGLQGSAWLAVKFVPGLAIGSTEGSLLNGTVKDIQYSAPGVEFAAGTFRLQVVNIRPLEAAFDIALLEADGIAARISDTGSEETEPSEPLTRIEIPVNVKLHSMTVKSTFISVPGLSAAFERFAMSATAGGSKVTVDSLSLDSLNLTVPKDEETEPKAAEPVLKTVRALFAKPLLEGVELPATLPIEVELGSATFADISVNDEPVLESASLSAEVGFNGIKIPQISVQTAEVQVSATAAAGLGDDPEISLAGKVEPRLEPLSNYPTELSLTAKLKDSAAIEATVNAEKPLHLLMRIALTEADPAFSLAAKGDIDLNPFTKAGEKIENFEFDLQGRFSSYQLALKGNLKTKQLPQTLAFSLSAPAQELTFNDAKLHLTHGTADVDLAVSGGIDETKTRAELNLNAALKQADIFAFVPDLVELLSRGANNATLSVKAAIEGDGLLTPESFKADISSLEARGAAAGKAFRVTTKGSGTATGEAEIETLSATYSETKLSARGTYRNGAVLGNLRLDAPSLADIHPNLEGKVNLKADITGTFKAPKLSASGSATELAYQDIFVRDASLSAKGSFDKELQGLFKLSARDIQMTGEHLESVDFTFSGNERKHTAILASNGSPAAADVRISGTFDRAASLWKGTLEQASFKSLWGTWSAQGRPGLVFDSQKTLLTAKTHCWKNVEDPLVVCFDKDITAGETGDVSLSVRDVRLALGRAVLPASVKPTGSFSAKANLSWSAPQPEAARADIVLQGHNLAFEADIAGVSTVFGLPQSEVTVKLVPGTLTLDAAFAARADKKTAGSAQTQIVITDPFGQRQLSGNLKLAGFDLSSLNPILSALSPHLTAKGIFEADLRPAGDLTAPRLFGSAKLAGFAASGEAVPLDLKPSDVDFAFDGTRSTISTVLQTEQGELELNGSADWKNPENVAAEFSAKGKEIRVSVPPYVTARVTPDVHIKADQENLDLAGSIVISRARVTVSSLSESAVSVSDDEVILDATQQPVQTKKTMRVKSSLVIKLAERVRLEAFGLKSGLSGQLAVTQDDDRLGLNGTVSLTDGTFKAYGQDLLINKGEITFAGPADNPILHLEAIRNPDAMEDEDVTAGIRITGPVSSPKTELFSDPSLSQANTLSYIMRGRALDSSTTGGDNSMITSALLGVGLSQAGSLISGVGEMLMIRDLNVSTAGTGDNSQVVVSGYVLPGLQVKYAMGIFDSFATLTLRYRVFARFFIEASSGLNQSLDAIYTFEF